MKVNLNKKIFRCKECNLDYENRKWANKCEKWCKKYKSCNLMITKHAIK